MSRRLSEAEKAKRIAAKADARAEKKRLKEINKAERERLEKELKDGSKKKDSLSTFTVSVLQTYAFAFSVLNEAWQVDKRYPETAISRFLSLNKESFSFLDVDAYGEYDASGEFILKLTTSKYIGCIPLLSPKTGLPTGNLIITGRFGEDVSELLSIIGEYVEPEFHDRITLSKGSFVKPPLYFECQNYIDHYIEAKKYKWRKFDNVERIQSIPTHSTRWDKYALKSYDPKNTFRYPNSCNILTKNHKEWEELNYVLDLCIKEVLSSRTPVRSRMAYMSRITGLQNTYDKRSLPIVSEIKTHMSDPIVIKSLKVIANRVLHNDTSANKAWRLDFAQFFERYVQFLMKEVARAKGARIECNPHYPVYGNKPAWALQRLEPDIIIDKSEIQYIIDAKYKAHIYQINGDGEKFKESFREDLHQVLAYSSFGGRRQKNVMLVYPSDHNVCRELEIISGINNYSSKLYLIGIPLKKDLLNETIKSLSGIIKFE